MRIASESGMEERELYVKRYFLIFCQRIWRVLITIDRVLNANILATRLDPNPDLSIEESVNFDVLKTEIKMIEDSMVPLIMKKLKKGDKLWPNKSVLCKQSDYGKELLKMERMIDLYLVNF